jgi:lysophospholipase L1-like esterase
MLAALTGWNRRACTIFCVARLHELQNTSSNRWIFRGMTSGMPQLYTGNNTSAGTIGRLVTNAAANPTSTLFYPCNTAIYAIRNSTTAYDVFLQDVASKYSATAHSTDTTEATGFRIMGNSTAGQRVAGDYYEFLVYGSALSDADMEATLAQLRSDYLLASWTTQIIVHGDSIPFGGKSATQENWPDLLGFDLPNTVKLINCGDPGKNIATLAGQGTNYIDAKKSASFTENLLLFQAGSNSLTASGETIYTALASYMADRATAGWTRSAVATITPRSDGVYSDSAANRTDFNARIRAGWPTISLGCMDFGAHPLIGDQGDEADTDYYNNDLCHPNGAGHQVMEKVALPIVYGALYGALPGNVKTGASNMGVGGTYPTTEASKAEQLATDQAAVIAAKGSIVKNVSILGTTGADRGTYAPTAAELGTHVRPGVQT